MTHVPYYGVGGAQQPSVVTLQVRDVVGRHNTSRKTKALAVDRSTSVEAPRGPRASLLTAACHWKKGGIGLKVWRVYSCMSLPLVGGQRSASLKNLIPNLLKQDSIAQPATQNLLEYVHAVDGDNLK